MCACLPLKCVWVSETRQSVIVLQHLTFCCVCFLLLLLLCLTEQPGVANNWNVCSPNSIGSMQPPDDWEIDISQLHIDSKVGSTKEHSMGMAMGTSQWLCASGS